MRPVAAPYIAVILLRHYLHSRPPCSVVSLARHVRAFFRLEKTMTLSELRERAIAPALALLPARMSGLETEVLLLAIGLQESRLTHRRQIGGPARGLWQFERGGGVSGVLRHAATRDHALRVCDARSVAPVPEQVYQRLEYDDVLAAAFARLFLWTDPKPLPAVGEIGAAWDYYLRTWRPGKPHQYTWDTLYARAMDAVLEVA